MIKSISEENVDKISSELDHPFTKKEFLFSVKNLKNNIATSFDCISNEMLKAGVETLHSVILPIFNTTLKFNIYPTQWTVPGFPLTFLQARS